MVEEYGQLMVVFPLKSIVIKIAFKSIMWNIPGSYKLGILI